MALFVHGLRRVAEYVAILVTSQGLKAIHENLGGLGYLPLFSGSKNLRDTATGLRIEFLVTGQFPGDGKPKAVAFPDPAEVACEKDGIKFVNLPTLMTLGIRHDQRRPREGSRRRSGDRQDIGSIPRLRAAVTRIRSRQISGVVGRGAAGSRPGITGCRLTGPPLPPSQATSPNNQPRVFSPL